MAKKSKTQRAKASARRAEKKQEAKEAALHPQKSNEVEKKPEKKSGLFSSKKNNSSKTSESKTVSRKKKAKEEKQPGRAALFFQGVRSEMKRVTWPSRSDILRWSGVVIGTLIFFSLFVFVLDNWIATPLLLAISSIGA